jgi:fucose permease
MMIAGRVAAMAGLAAGLLLYLFGHIGVLTYFGATVFSGFGNGLTMPSANAGALSVRPQLAGSAAGLAGAMTVGGGALLTSLVGAIISAEHAAWQLLGAMFLCALAGLLAALYVRRIDRIELECVHADDDTGESDAATARDSAES